MVDFLPEKHVEDSRILNTLASERQRMQHFGYDYTNHHEAERSITCGSQFISDLSFVGMHVGAACQCMQSRRSACVGVR